MSRKQRPEARPSVLWGGGEARRRGGEEESHFPRTWRKSGVVGAAVVMIWKLGSITIFSSSRCSIRVHYVCSLDGICS